MVEICIFLFQLNDIIIVLCESITQQLGYLWCVLLNVNLGKQIELVSVLGSEVGKCHSTFSIPNEVLAKSLVAQLTLIDLLNWEQGSIPPFPNYRIRKKEYQMKF